MNKAAIIEEIHRKIGGTKTAAEDIVNSIFGMIIDSLKRGEEVSIAGFGIFSVKQRAARQARNPRTGEVVEVPAMKVPKFKPAKALKEAVK